MKIKHMICDTMKYQITNDQFLTSKAKLEILSNTKFNYETI